MSGFRGIVKEGWHPKGRDGGKESWRGDFKGINQVAGWMGKKADPHKQEDVHVSRPLSSLKDPASFGPPPKNVNYHGGAALPNEITPQTEGWGAPLRPDQISTANTVASGPTDEEIGEQNRKAGPPLPYRADRTGLKTDHLPPPPVHRDVDRSPAAAQPGPVRQQPRVPPRLPSRQPTFSTPTPPAVTNSPPPPAYESTPAAHPAQSSPGYGINQAAVNRLGHSGVSVPALGIGSGQPSNPWRNEQSQTIQPSSPPTNAQPATDQLSELQARFARMSSSASASSQQNVTPPFVTPVQSPPPPVQPSYTQPTQPQPQPQGQGTTWAEKQSAMRTAQTAYKDPSTVSAADAASAVRTANSFRERHKDSIDAAGNRANEWNKKYNVTGRLNSFLEKHSSPSPTSENGPNGGNGNAYVGQQPMQANSVVPPQQSPEVAASISRKPPPPPPPKKPANMHGSIGGMGVAPPPVPLGTKPSYS
ncbi:hypothetical protein G647_08661 [Cladophialophora carrionii CBS 160.54]|uniref:Uncharacterized protein n=1 Tax=Cladophialophora carrionii CBS 160.54 TaxID=1279043 RepID=V9CYC9_9EURO|nr:uncharacterized protein G647_08661 [Cladophialophora carrionii CBS 160.54]ETI19649.1 hypothetical protein G647_08661 [Cladophialophora carrionii CBS 160.54]